MPPIYDESIILNNFIEEYKPSKSKSVNKIMAAQRKEFKYKTRFNEIEIKAHLITDKKEKEKVITASVESLKPFLPNITENDYDLLAITANAYTVNLANRNNQLVGLSGIYAAKDFVGRFIDANHERTILLGYITNYGFSEFKTDKPLTEEEAVAAAQKGDVVNVVLGGVLWRVPNPEITDAIELASDPESDTYNDYSFSWECAFENFSIAEGGQLLSDCTILSDEEKVDGLKSMLKTFGGRGLNERGRPMHLLLSDFKPLAVSAVENPAAYVKGILVRTPESLDQEVISNESVNQEIESVMRKDKEKIAASFTDLQKEKISNLRSEYKTDVQKAIIQFQGKLNSIDYKDATTDFGRFYQNLWKAVFELASEEKIDMGDIFNEIAASIEPAKFSVTEVGKINQYAEEYNKTTDEYCQQLLAFLCEGDSFEVAAQKTNDYFANDTGLVVQKNQYAISPDENNELNKEKSIISAEIVENDENKILKTVKKNITNFNMTKLTKIADLSTEILKEISASEIKEVVASETAVALQEAAKSFTDQIAAEKQAKEKVEELLNAATEKLNELNDKIGKIEAEQAQVKAEADFQNRMTYLSDEFELSDEQRGAYLDDIKACANEEAWTKLVSKISVFAAKKKKMDKVDKKEDEVDASTLVASLEPIDPNIPNKEIATESTAELFARILAKNVKLEVSKK